MSEMMIKYLITILFVLLAGSGTARETYNLDRHWKFYTWDDQDAAFVNLPHTWNQDALSGTKRYYRGIGNYLKHFDVPARWQGKRIFLHVTSACFVTDVLVNGRHVGEQRGGDVAFTFEITEHLRYGVRNYLWIMVNNAPRLDVLPTAGDFNKYGGLTGGVSLFVTGTASIDGTGDGSDGVRFTTTELTEARAAGYTEVMVSAGTDLSYNASVALLSPQGDTVSSRTVPVRLKAGERQRVRIPFEVARPNRWNGMKDPYLYHLEAKISAGKDISDSVSFPVGFRTVSVDPKRGFLLNGQPYPVRGVVVHKDRAMVGSAMNELQVKRDMELIAEMGANAVRIADRPHARSFYDLCDRAGILVFTEIPFVGAVHLANKSFIDNEGFKQNGCEQLQRMIRQLYNSPCVVAWGLFSELSVRGEDPTEYIRRLQQLAREEDPHRMTYACSNQDGAINFVTDLIVWNHAFGWKEGLPDDLVIWLDQLHRNWSGLRSAVSYAAGGAVFHQGDSLRRPAYAGNWHPERWQTFFHERYLANLKRDSLLWGIFVGNMFDYGSVLRSWGEGNGINDCGLVTFDRNEQKDAYYLYKANWNRTEPFVYLAEKRWGERKDHAQRIKVYANVPEVELFVNGVSKGKKQASADGIFLWENLMFPVGESRVEVRSGALKDEMRLRILDSRTKRF